MLLYFIPEFQSVEVDDRMDEFCGCRSECVCCMMGDAATDEDCVDGLYDSHVWTGRKSRHRDISLCTVTAGTGLHSLHSQD